MAFSGNYMCSSFLQEILVKGHDFTVTTGDTFKIALYDNTPAFNAGTTAYVTGDELAATGNYTTGGESLTNVTPQLTSTTAWVDFDDLVWSTATFTTYGGLLYNSTAGTDTVLVLGFGGAKTATAGDFTIQFPTPDSSSAIIRISGP